MKKLRKNDSGVAMVEYALLILIFTFAVASSARLISNEVTQVALLAGETIAGDNLGDGTSGGTGGDCPTCTCDPEEETCEGEDE